VKLQTQWQNDKTLQGTQIFGSHCITISRLQHVQNTLTRVVAGHVLPHGTHSSAILQHLHWLPENQPWSLEKGRIHTTTRSVDSGWQATSYVFPIIGIPRPQWDGHQPEEHVEKVVQRKHGDAHSKKTWDGYIWCGTRRRTWLLTDHTGDKLLPNVLCSMGGTKSKSTSASNSNLPYWLITRSTPLSLLISALFLATTSLHVLYMLQHQYVDGSSCPHNLCFLWFQLCCPLRMELIPPFWHSRLFVITYILSPS